MPSVNTEVYVGYVDVDVDLEDFETEDLIQELESRGLSTEITDTAAIEMLRIIYENRRAGKDYEHELNCLIYAVLGRVS